MKCWKAGVCEEAPGIGEDPNAVLAFVWHFCQYVVFPPIEYRHPSLLPLWRSLIGNHHRRLWFFLYSYIGRKGGVRFSTSWSRDGVERSKGFLRLHRVQLLQFRQRHAEIRERVSGLLFVCSSSYFVFPKILLTRIILCAYYVSFYVQVSLPVVDSIFVM